MPRARPGTHDQAPTGIAGRGGAAAPPPASPAIRFAARVPGPATGGLAAGALAHGDKPSNARSEAGGAVG
ncbi:hypothetical protein [Pseudofrankia sp. DC12]|uniref:hypothetical protein n=1 Tax=Pseudofrankia sp. DC12 TaxID=683315 RepID=UPI000ADA33B0|nr:hypothetical protein [Pseudofrankia sp. DC12]